MSEILSKAIEEVVEKKAKKFNSQRIKKLEKAVEMFDKAVDKGLTTRRGNNLMPFDKVHMYNCLSEKK